MYVSMSDKIEWSDWFMMKIPCHCHLKQNESFFNNKATKIMPSILIFSNFWITKQEISDIRILINKRRKLDKW